MQPLAIENNGVKVTWHGNGKFTVVAEENLDGDVLGGGEFMRKRLALKAGVEQEVNIPTNTIRLEVFSGSFSQTGFSSNAEVAMTITHCPGRIW